MVGVIWYRFVRCGGTDWSDTLVPIRPLQWYRLKRYVGTDSSATVVPIRRYYHLSLISAYWFTTFNAGLTLGFNVMRSTLWRFVSSAMSAYICVVATFL